MPNVWLRRARGGSLAGFCRLHCSNPYRRFTDTARGSLVSCFHLKIGGHGGRCDLVGVS